MRVGFLYVGRDTSLPAMMVASVKREIGCPVWQMSDKETPQVAGADVVVRKPHDGNLMTFRLEHLAGLPAGDWLILDVDVIVNRDPSAAFAEGYDVALTKRDGFILDEKGQNVALTMPYNTGVMFCRNPFFWVACARHLKTLPPEDWKWWGDQKAVAAMAPKFRCLELPSDTYNYTPYREFEELESRAVVHFKGERKGWMRGYAERRKLYGPADFPGGVAS